MDATSPARPRFGYVMPVYQAHSGEHLAHVPRLLAAIGRQADVEVIIWKCQDEPPAFDGVTHIHQLRARDTVARLLEMRRLVRQRVAAGVRNWFVRTAPLPGLAASWGGATLYYWLAASARPHRSSSEWLSRKLANYVHRRADYIVTARGLEEYNQQAFGVPPSKTVFLDNDIDPNQYHPITAAERAVVRQRLGIPERALLLFYVHRLTTPRGAHLLLPVLRRCAAAGLQVCLVAVGGPGDQSTELAAYAGDHHEQLRLLGHLPNDELPGIYAASDLFLMPSQSEGLPRVVLEAMACGTPVVSTDVGCVARLIPNEWWSSALVARDDAVAFSARVVDLLRDPAARQNYGAALLERSAEYHTERVAQEYIRLLGGTRR